MDFIAVAVAEKMCKEVIMECKCELGGLGEAKVRGEDVYCSVGKFPDGGGTGSRSVDPG